MTDIKEMMEEARSYLDDVVTKFNSSFFLRVFFYRELDKLKTAKEIVETTEMYAKLYEQDVIKTVYATGEIMAVKPDGSGRKEN